MTGRPWRSRTLLLLVLAALPMAGCLPDKVPDPEVAAAPPPAGAPSR